MREFVKLYAIVLVCVLLACLGYWGIAWFAQTLAHC